MNFDVQKSVATFGEEPPGGRAAFSGRIRVWTRLVLSVTSRQEKISVWAGSGFMVWRILWTTPVWGSTPVVVTRAWVERMSRIRRQERVSPWARRRDSMSDRR